MNPSRPSSFILHGLNFGVQVPGLEDCKSHVVTAWSFTSGLRPRPLELIPESRRRSTDRRCGPAPMLGSDVVSIVYICECGVPPWEVELGKRWPILGLGRDYLLLGSALWHLRWKCSCLSRNENKEFIFVSVKVVTKMPCDRIRGWSRLIKSEFCLDEKL